MDPRDSFATSDSVRIGSFEYDLQTPPGAPGGHFNQMDLCIKKTSGSLSLVLHTKADLDLPFELPITFRAQAPLPTGPQPRITWTVHEEGLNVALGGGATLRRIDGSITSTFQEITPRISGLSCDGAQRAVGASFQTDDPSQNQLKLGVDGGPSGDWKVVNIKMTGGIAGEPLSVGNFDVSIRTRQGNNQCQSWVRPGQAVWFDANVTNLPSGASLAFEWTVQGAAGGTAPSVLATLPSAGSEFSLSVKVTATVLGVAGTKMANLSFTVLSDDEVNAIERACTLGKLAKSYETISLLLPGSQNKIPGFVDPIFDGLPFFQTVGTPVSAESLRNLLARVEPLRIQSTSTANFLKKAISHEVERHAKPEIFAIRGHVLNSQTGNGVAGLRIEAWDKDLVFNDLVGSAISDSEGAFRIEFNESYFAEGFLDRKPDLFFKLFEGNALIRNTKDAVHWNVNKGDIPIDISV